MAVDKELGGSPNQVITLTASTSRVPVAVIVITFNGEPDLGQCLSSVSGWADEIFIVDSFSTDGTLEVARRFTDRIYHHRFEGFAAQRNWALHNLPFSHEWVLFLDQDESLTEELRAEVSGILRDGVSGINGFYIKRRFMFMGRWLRQGGYYPGSVLRLFRWASGRVVDAGLREYVVVKGRVGVLQHDMIHESVRDLSSWIAKHNRYADTEAAELMARTGRENLKAAGGTGVLERRWYLWLRAHIWDRLPPLIRPLLLFFYRYIVRLGFLDGVPGLIYCFLHDLWYPFLIDAKHRELRLQSQDTERDLASKAPPQG